MACARTSSAKGQVEISVSVLPDGSIDAVSAKTSPDPALGQCVVDVAKRAVFPKTRTGGSFGYPFVF